MTRPAAQSAVQAVSKVELAAVPGDMPADEGLSQTHTRVLVHQSVVRLAAGSPPMPDAHAGFAPQAQRDGLAPACDGRQAAADPDPDPSASDAATHDGAWGFADTRFVFHPDRSVSLSGSRYPLCGQRLVKLVPWVEQVMGITLAHDDVCPQMAPAALPAPADCGAFMAELADVLAPGQVSVDEAVRRRHAHGHTQAEIYALNHGDGLRAPDCVVFVQRHAEVEAVVSAARRHEVSLIPYGGGTSVTEALACPAGELRPIVSLDTSRLDRLVWVDPVNRMACIEAGAKGRHIAAALAPYGLTMGHEPDSLEFSTLGGWIATHASGMKKNRYGNIEDIVMDMTVVTADGTLARPWAQPRESVGVDVRGLMFGSEGRFGVVTQAVVALSELPQDQQYASVLFPDFEAGVAFMYALSRSETQPASARLVDNLQFQFGMALGAEASGLAAAKSALGKFYITRVRGLDPDKMVALTLVFEGGRAQVARDSAAVLRLAKQHGGVAGGSDHGRRGYQLTFGIAYIRDFIMRHWIVAESFETSVAWSGVGQLIERVKRRIMREHRSRGLPGRPAVLARVTQMYGGGACIYFYMAIYLKGVAQPSEVFADIEAAAREEILQAGGSLSHHHGVGKLRQRWLPKVMSATTLAWGDKIKSALDPQNVFGCDNQQHHRA